MTQMETKTIHNMSNRRNSMQVKFVLSAVLMLLLVMPGAFAQTEGKPQIQGLVAGGGRMADVQSNSEVKIFKADSIGFVYGGNDIAGEVQGAGGSTVQIGKGTGNAQPIRIGSVYGGGNGYYNYQNTTGTGDSTKVSGMVGVYKRNADGTNAYTITEGDANYVATILGDAARFVPRIQKTQVDVYGDVTYIDSLFGGARNAYITSATATNGATVNIHNGTITSVFGGNNVGGSIEHQIAINVSGTKTSDDPAYADSLGVLCSAPMTPKSSSHGIRYLIGGGNKIPAPDVTVNFTGGQVDTAFAGGNSATVTATTFTVNVSDPHYSEYSKDQKVFDIRCLFGGNNAADMAIMPTLTLTKGGVGTVYGGGNSGSMVCTTNSVNVGNGLGNKSIGAQVNLTSDNMVVNYLYGGCQRANVTKGTYINMTEGHAGVVYGGCNISGAVGDPGSFVMLTGGTVHEMVFGGANGDYGCNDNTYYTSDFPNDGTTVTVNTTTIPTIQNTYVWIKGVTVGDSIAHTGNVYAGGNKAPVGTSGTNNGIANVILQSGTVNGDVYGGGRQANIYGYTNLDIPSTNAITLYNLYGGNDIAGGIEGSSNRTGSTFDGTSLSSIGAYVKIEGKPNITGSVFGGGNGDYIYDRDTTVGGQAMKYVLRPEDGSFVTYVCDGVSKPTQSSSYVDLNMGEDGAISNVFGGGNAAEVTAAHLYVKGEGSIANVYGGGNLADVGSATTTVKENVSITTAFAGGNGATATSSATLTVDDDVNRDTKIIETLFGGNNQAEMDILPTLTLTDGYVGTIYGGGNAGNMTGEHSTTITSLGETRDISTFIQVNSSDFTADLIYGGCKKADVTAGTYVKVTGGTVNGIYGGNDISGTVAGSSYVDLLEGGIVNGNVFGGGNGDYGCITDGVYANDPATENDGLTLPVINETYVYVGGASTDSETNPSTIYAGGNKAPVGNATDKNGHAKLVLQDGTVNTVYGGGRMADINGYSEVVINEDNTIHITGDLYAGNDIAGGITGTSTHSVTLLNGTTVAGIGAYLLIEGNPDIDGSVYGGGNGDYIYDNTSNIVKTQDGDTVATLCGASAPTQVNSYVDLNMGEDGAIANVFGGGNAAEVTGSTNVYVMGDGDITTLYGGGNLAAVGTANTVIKGATTGTAFAGGNGASATTAANITVDDDMAAATRGEGKIVNVLFGGNNQATMEIIPAITLTEGYLGEVYGGGNAGDMTGSTTVSVDGSDRTVGTKVIVDNDDVKADAVYGGCKMADVTNGTYVNLNAGEAGVVYGGCNVSGDVAGTSYVVLSGGTAGKAFGGGNGDYGCNEWNDDIDSLVYSEAPYAGTALPTIMNTYVLVDGDCTVSNNIYGGGDMAPVATQENQTGSTTVKLVSGNITGAAFGGGRQAYVYGSANIFTAANSSIVMGAVYGGNDIAGSVTGANRATATLNESLNGTALTQGNAAAYVQINGNPQIGTVFGGGNGEGYTYPTVCGAGAPDQISAYVDVNLNGEDTENSIAQGYIRTIYGGGNAASIRGGSDATLNNTVVYLAGAGRTDSVYGGCRMTDVDYNTNVYMVDGTVGTIYGACNISGDVANVSNVYLQGGTVLWDVFGGANGNYGCNDGNTYYTSDWDAEDGVTVVPNTTKIPHVAKTNVVVNTTSGDGVTVNQSVYGGGDMAPVGTNTNANGTVNVTLTKGHVEQDVYGGGRMASVYGNSTVTTVEGSTIEIDGALYGGNDIAGTVTGTTEESAARTSTDNPGFPTFNNGDAATLVIIKGEPQIGTVYGGGNGNYVYVEEENKVYESDSTTLAGRFCGMVSDILPEVDAAAYVYFNADSDAEIGALYGGGNAADVKKAFTMIEGEGVIHDAFAGGNGATVTDSVVLTVNAHPTKGGLGDTIYNIYNVFGGNNMVDMDIVPFVNLEQGHVVNVYGGGKEGAMKGGDSQVDPTTGETYTISTRVIINNDAVVIDTVYGGGKMAGTDNDTYISMTDGNVGTIYGGSNISGKVEGSTNVILAGGEVHDNVFGGANGDYGENDNTVYTDGVYDGTSLPITNNTNVVMKGTCDVDGNVYGGGNMAPVGSMTTAGKTNVELVSGNIDGDGFGGGRMASVFGVAGISTDPSSCNGESSCGTCEEPLTVNGGLYGGNDISGTVTGAGQTGTAMDGTTLTQENAATYLRIEGSPYIHEVYGGGNGDYCYGTTENPDKIYVRDASGSCATEIGTLYGSTALPTETSAWLDINLKSCGIIDTSYGGGNAAEVGRATTYITSADASSVGTIGVAFGGGRGATVTTQVDITIDGAKASDGTTKTVGTVFGGNNLADMDIVPNIELSNGRVGTVYGGGNKGDMNASGTVINGDEQLEKLSTFVSINNTDIEITDNVYGGCRAADVANGTYVSMTDGQVNGDIFGGNDVAGDAHYTHIVIEGSDDTHHPVATDVFGGSNGKYTYIETTPGSGKYNVYEYEQYDPEHPEQHLLAVNTNGVPNCDSTDVQLLANATVNGNAYGGGMAGDAKYTYMNVDGVEANGTIFGAGCGIVETIGANPDCAGQEFHRQGNVSQTAKLDLRQLASTSTIKEVYGGGHAGNVANTEFTVYNTLTKSLVNLYGGCFAADVTGKAQTQINGNTGVSGNIIDTVYGGNNFAGWVDSTILNITTGSYSNIYGGGNGAYVYWKDARITPYLTYYTVADDETHYHTQNQAAATLITQNGDNWTISGSSTNYTTYESALAAVISSNLVTAHSGANATCVDTLPYSNIVTLNLTNPTVNGNLYGGGNLGIVGKDYSGDGTVTAVIDSTTLSGTSYAGTTSEYGEIVTNIYGGTYNGQIFAGARGRDESDPYFGKNKMYDRRQLAFAVKEVNMYDGHAMHSLYGGSEFIDDGYPWECSADNTTLRPSSISNIMGGTIEKNMYGGGYLGNIYGSVYVNVGVKAVDSSYVWTRLYGESDFARLKPEMVAHDLYLNASVYNGSDWGEAGTNAVFITPGFYGGESQIFVDGKGYNTSLNTAGSSLPDMDIAYSLFGAGTSTEGGDMRRQIIVRHYGDYVCPTVSKGLYSIQRADLVILDSCFFNLTGEQDAYSAYPSPDYTFNRIDTLTLRGKNVVILTNPAVYLGALRSEEPHKIIDYTSNDGHASGYCESELTDAADLTEDVTSCPANFCDKMSGGDQMSNRLILDGGIYVSVLPYMEKYVDGAATGENDNAKYGPVLGYMYLGASDNTRSYVYARMKGGQASGFTGEMASYNGQPINENDGGFVSLCFDENQQVETNYNGEYLDPTAQVHYNNANVPQYTPTDSTNYRVWNIGHDQGDRRRHITIVANAEVVQEPGCYNVHVPRATIDDASPATTTDEFAVSYGTLQLPPSASGNYYDIVSMVVDQDNAGQMQMVYTAYDSVPGAANGSWLLLDPTNRNDYSERARIVNDSSYTFGLMFRLGANFAEEAGAVEGASNATVLVGNDNFSDMNGFKTFPVSLEATQGVIPEIRFALTYSTKFSQTLIRDVVFNLMEKDAEGNEVGLVEVTVTIATVLRNFRDLEIPLLAMYNEGESNIYSRKIIIPASFQRRTLTLRNVEWEPDPVHDGETDELAAQKFSVVAADGSITENNQFGVSVNVTENVSDNIANTLGWYDIVTRDFDPYTEAGCTAQSSNYNYAEEHPGQSMNTTIGTLDGRATAALDVSLHFNGNLVYPDDKCLGYINLYMDWVSGDGLTEDQRGTFNVKLRVWSRTSADTIYIASKSAPSWQGTVRRGDKTLHQAGFIESERSGGEQAALYGRHPDSYVTSFGEAMNLYQTGDVLCIIDTVNINGQTNTTLRGDDYNTIQIIRYSGSHPDAGGDQYAYRGPMIRLTDNGKFTAVNVRFNGSGLTRVWGNKYDDVSTHEHAFGPETEHVSGNSDARWPDTIWAEAPIIVMEGNSICTFNRNVSLIHNFNGRAYNMLKDEVGTSWGTANHDKSRYPGGAVGIYASESGTPRLNIGNNVVIADNCVVSGSDLRGAGIYNDGGTIMLGYSVNGGDEFYVNRNYTLPEDRSGFTTETIQTLWHNNGLYYCYKTFDDYPMLDTARTENGPAYTFTSRYGGNIDTIPLAKGAMLSNVFLTRTAKAGLSNTDYYGHATQDAKTDLVSFNSKIGTDSRVGITKWFPGTNNTPSATDLLCRDTIQFARLTISRPVYCEQAYQQNNFFDDSLTSYVFFHRTLSPYTIYFQRCATFKQRTTEGYKIGEDIMVAGGQTTTYHYNPSAKCSAVLDTLRYRVQGGFYPYTYTWQAANAANEIDWEEARVVRSDTSDYDNAISQLDIEGNLAKREASSVDTCVLVDLAMMPTLNKLDYVYRVVGNDLTGNCPVPQEVDIRVLRTEGDPYTSTRGDSKGDAAWLDKDNISIPNPGYDGNQAAIVGEDTRIRYMRVCKGVHLDAEVLPSFDYANITIFATDLQETGNYTMNIVLNAEDEYEINDVTQESALKGEFFCPGDILTFGTEPKVTASGTHEFVMWDVDPAAPTQGFVFTMPDHDAHVKAIYKPSGYWYQVVTSLDGSFDVGGGEMQTPDYSVDYDGNVTIGNEAGLAWLISTANGLNNQQAQQFNFKTVTISAADPLDMSAYRWTPLGNINNPFSGSFDGGDVTINGITCIEDNIPHVGFFGVLNGATVEDVSLAGAVISGNNYVGGLAAYAMDTTKITSSKISNTCAISGAYCVGGLVGRADGADVKTDDNELDGIEFLGNAIYSGGAVGYMSSGVTVENNTVVADFSNMQYSTYQGGAAGVVEASEMSGKKGLFGRRKGTAKPSNIAQIKNNYVHIVTNGNGERVGGLVGSVSGTEMVNNYAYGDVSAEIRQGAVAGMVGNYVVIDRCYYLEGTSDKAFGYGAAGKATSNISSFEGSGNRCYMNEYVDGVNNVTRILNKWVKAQGDGSGYKTWCSDMKDVNNGYPIFGTPDMIPVTDTTRENVCDSMIWNGQTLTADAVYRVNVVDSTEMIDSTMIYVFTIGRTETSNVEGEIVDGEGYEGNGFSLTAEDIEAYRGAYDRLGIRTIQIIDSLLTERGCDSIVTLTLTIYPKQGVDPEEEVEVFDVNVYPNPTRSLVNVEADGLQQVEVYDALSRRVKVYEANGQNCQFDLSPYSTGIYYLRVKTIHGVAVKKVIKK